MEIIPSKKEPYNKPFTPSDRTTGTRRPLNEKIRQIGQAFYDMATGVPGALSMLFNVLPDVIAEVSELDRLSKQQRASYKILFDKAY